MALHFVINIILVRDSKVLIEKSRAGVWKLPGGHIEEGEDPVRACKREALEELGCKISIVTPPPLIDPKTAYPTPLTLFIDQVQSDSALDSPHQNLGLTYAAITSEEVYGAESQEIQWCSPDELRQVGVFESIVVLAEKALELMSAEHHTW